MSSSFTFPEDAKLVNILEPAADAAGRTGDYISLKNYHKAYIVATVTQGHATPAALTPKQASAVAGTGVKAISATRIWANNDCAASDALVRATDAVTYSHDAELKIKMAVFEIDPAALDQANGFDCVTLVTGASNAANITTAIAVLCPSRYPSATPPSAIID